MTVETRYARVCWNTDGWSKPSNVGRRAEQQSFVAQHGFGMEEWLFDLQKVLDGWHYCHLQPVHRALDRLTPGEHLRALLYTKSPDGRRLAVGEIETLEVIDKDTAEWAVAEYRRRGWLEQRRDQLEELGLGAKEVTDPPTPYWIFCCRFRPADARRHDPLRPLPPKHEVRRIKRYELGYVRTNGARTWPKGARAISADSAPWFVVGHAYTRPQIRRLLGVAHVRGGNWDTGYNRHNGEWFLFPNVGSAGRTGHDYPNRWTTDGLLWFGKTGSRLRHESIQSMLAPGARVHLFVRSADRDPFLYKGLVSAVRKRDVSPVEIVWRVESAPALEDRPIPEEMSGRTYPEGAVRVIKVNAYERSPQARQACIRIWGTRCVVCGFSAAERYGEAAAGFIHVHHLTLHAHGGERDVDPAEDLRPVCPNCHGIIHLSATPRSLEQVRDMLRPWPAEPSSVV